MNKYEEFLNYFESINGNAELPKVVAEVLEELRGEAIALSNKPLFTESGLQILTYMQGSDVPKMKAKDIADGMKVSSRKVSGAIRKLVSDGFVDKIGKEPVIYSLTEKGKDFDIITYVKENTSNEEETE